jgi:hypothetical protein
VFVLCSSRALGCTFYHVCALQVPWVDVAGKGMLNLARSICSKPLDFTPLAAHYSRDLLELLASFAAKDSVARPPMRDVLSTPVVQNSPLFRAVLGEEHTAPTCDEGTQPALGADAHAAAAVLQRSLVKRASRERGKLLPPQAQQQQPPKTQTPHAQPQPPVQGPPQGYSAAVRKEHALLAR